MGSTIELNPMVCDTDDPGLLATGNHGADEHLGATKKAQVTCCRNESVRDSQGSRMLYSTERVRVCVCGEFHSTQRVESGSQAGSHLEELWLSLLSR